jgi:molybdenum cofactor cytidylyltransferase
MTTRSPSFAGVILAAGASSRMGQDKALLSYEGATFLSGAIRMLQGACDFVVVVTGNNTELLKPVIYQSSAYYVRNAQPELGQFSSLRVGFQAVLDRGRDTACVTLVDRPPALPSTLAKLQQEFLQTSPDSTWAVVPQFNGKHGHPVLFSREMIEVCLRADPTTNAREVEHRYQNRIEYVDVDDRRIVININTPEDYSAIRETSRNP